MNNEHCLTLYMKNHMGFTNDKKNLLVVSTNELL
jgi:hypothetical protein